MSQGMAHEIRNPLGGIRGAAQLLEMGVSELGGPQGELAQYASIIVEEVDRLDRVVERHLRYGLGSEGAYRPLDLLEAVEGALFLVEAEASRIGVRIERAYSDDLPPVEGDMDELKQVFLNLARNALEAMPEGGGLRVEARVGGAGSVRAVEAQFCDTGMGVPAGSREEIFDLFYTTKRRGVGIGLSLTKRIVEQHGGSIEAADREGGGSCFTVSLPAL